MAHYQVLGEGNAVGLGSLALNMPRGSDVQIFNNEAVDAR